jgi:hypothetical protein
MDSRAEPTEEDEIISLSQQKHRESSASSIRESEIGGSSPLL